LSKSESIAKKVVTCTDDSRFAAQQEMTISISLKRFRWAKLHRIEAKRRAGGAAK